MRDRGRAVALIALNVAALVALALGIVLLRGSEIGFSPGGAVAGIASQLPTTLPAAVLVLGAAAANVLLGATLVRVVLRRPFASVSSLVLAGLVGAVVIDTAALMLLGGVGVFRWPLIVALHLAGLAAGAWRARPLLSGRPRLWRELRAAGPAGWLLIAAVWSAPFLLQLASPVVPFLDVLPNHVAPVEHLRTFGSYETLTTAPSPIYGPSRIFLGYVALLATLSTLTTLPAALTVAAFALPMTLLLALAARRLATAIFGERAAYWALIAAPLSVVFLRLPDARASVLVFALVSFALAHAVEESARDDATQNGDLVLGATLGAAILVHPVMGALATATVLLLAAWSARLRPIGIPAVVVASLLAVPQGVLMLGVDAPSWLGLAAFAVAPAAGVAARGTVHWIGLPRASATGLPVLLAVLALIVYAPDAVPALGRVVADAASRFPLLAIAAILAVTIAARRGRWQLPVAMVIVSVAAGVTAELLPAGSVISDSIRFEMPKTLAYWWSWGAVPLAAGVLADTWRGRGWPRGAGPTLVVVFVVSAVLPLRVDPVGINDHLEYRMAESVSVALHHAERGYWAGYPDSRTIVDPAQRELLAALRAEIDAGRIDARSGVLHVAGSFQQWASTPLGVFTGVIETTATLDPEESIHTVGGRLHGVDELPTLLRAGRYRYLVFEPSGLDATLRAWIAEAGYEPIFVNARAELLRAPPAE